MPFFEVLCLQDITAENFEIHPDPIQRFNETVLQIAIKCTLKTSTHSSKMKNKYNEAIKAPLPPKPRKTIQ